ncbi:MAG: OmpA family protein [Pseudomonadota bacterium]
MSQSVDRLKQLLFDQEARDLEALRQRIDDLREDGDQARALLRERVDSVFERAGTRERLQASVADVLDGSLRDAEVRRHHELSQAMAPLVVKTIKNQITNSRDEMVQALYPITGKMVKAYVASAMKDMMDQINGSLERSIPGQRMLLKLRAMLTGRSMAELAMTDALPIEIEELYYIRRGSGEMIGHWVKDEDPIVQGGSNRDAIVSGYLSAITEFAKDAFDDEGSSMRTLELNHHKVYLRDSPTYLLAVKCSGTDFPAVQRIVDEEFVRVMETHADLLMPHARDRSAPAGEARPNGKANGNGAANGHDTAAPRGDGSTTNGQGYSQRPVKTKNRGDRGGRPASPNDFAAVLPELALRLQTRMNEARALLPRRRAGNPLKVIAWLIALPLLAWLAWWGWTSYRGALNHDTAQRIIINTPEMKGFPTRIVSEENGTVLRISGLAPSDRVKARVIERIGGALGPGTRILDNMGVLPLMPGVDPRPQIAKVRDALSGLEIRLMREGIERALERAERRLEASVAKLDGLETQLAGTPGAERTRRAFTASRTAQGEITAVRAKLNEQPTTAAGYKPIMDLLISATTKVDDAVRTLARVNAPSDATARPDTITARSRPATAVVAAEELALATERLAVTSGAVERKAALRPFEQRVRGVRRSLTNVDNKVLDVDERVKQLQRALAALAQRKPPPPQIQIAPQTPRAKLLEWARDNAIFFSKGARFRDDAEATRTLDAMATLLKGNAITIRIIGYTDERGSARSNARIAQARADAVKAGLIDRGVPAARMSAIGRSDLARRLSTFVGDNSPNRRVEFELGFKGERPQGTP